MQEPDIRWQQRFSNYNKALDNLTSSVHYIQLHLANGDSPIDREAIETPLSNLIKQGLIQSFEFTHELAWNVMKDYLHYQGFSTIQGLQDATRAAFRIGLIQDGEVWMEMIKSRNATSHTYNETTANAIFTKIVASYYPAFVAFRATMESLQIGQ
jgi:nucleotidyltransferase substrate binding protein (TIGR01987 family)